jgi:hypothetical protein
MLFQQYTGNALMNNALQTIEALAGVDQISDMTTEKLKKLIAEPIKGRRETLIELNTRLKSYTMLFSRNGPLLNDAKFGQRIYGDLLNRIVDNFEKDGDYLCEITGLRYQTTFANYYEKTLEHLGFDKKQIASKDTSLNRCWLPLAGSLGSDAQALPQAKFPISVHPICLVVLQFLPLSALIYRGNILLIDSANFEFSREYVASNTDEVKKRVELTPKSAKIENLKEFSKGHYLLKAMEIFEVKQVFSDQYTDLNLWGFSNSGTGASCEIDRVPNALFQKLKQLHSTVLRRELQEILYSKMSNSFLEALNDGKDFWGLYPAKDFKGASVEFFEAYQKVIGNTQLLQYAKYISGLILSKIDLSKSEKALLQKTDAYKQSEYVDFFFKIIIDATVSNKWNLIHHTQILDDKDAIPLRAYIYGIYKLVHFYFLNKEFSTELPNTEGVSNNALSVCKIYVDILNKNKEVRGEGIIKDLKGRDFQEPTLNEPMIRISTKTHDFETIYPLIYNVENKQNKYGLRELLRIYFNNPIELPNTEGVVLIEPTLEQKAYLKKIELFATTYFEYYEAKYFSDYAKFNRHVLQPMRGQDFRIAQWIISSITNMNTFYKDEKKEDKLAELKEEAIFSENILYDFMGNYNASFTRFAIDYYLNHKFHSLTKKETN